MQNSFIMKIVRSFEEQWRLWKGLFLGKYMMRDEMVNKMRQYLLCRVIFFLNREFFMKSENEFISHEYGKNKYLETNREKMTVEGYEKLA